MPCRYNTFDGRLLWFDGVEGKRGLTLPFFFGGGGGGGRSGEQTVSLRLTSFRHYYFPQVLSMVTFCKLSFVTATCFDPSTDNKNSVNIYIFK